MKATFKRTAIAAVVALAMPAGSLYADQAREQNRAQGSAAPAQSAPQARQDEQRSMSQLPASELIGTSVTNNEGEDLGEIKELMVNLDSGRVHYAVVEFGGFLGMGEKQFAYPLRAFTAAPAQNKVLLNVEKSQLEQSEGFDRDRFPSATDPYWGRVDRVFGGSGTPRVAEQTPPREQPSAAAGASAPADAQPEVMRASQLIGKDVKDSAGQDAGEVKDLVVDLDNGEVRHAVIELEGSDRRVNVPMSDITASADGDDLRLNKALSQLSGERHGGASSGQ